MGSDIKTVGFSFGEFHTLFWALGFINENIIYSKNFGFYSEMLSENPEFNDTVFFVLIVIIFTVWFDSKIFLLY